MRQYVDFQRIDEVRTDVATRLKSVTNDLATRFALVHTLLQKSFLADLRSLAVYRVFIGLAVLLDLMGRVSDARILYSDEGLFPRAYALTQISRWQWSFMYANGRLDFTYAFFAATAIVAVLVMLGYRTRLMMILLWALVLSIQARNPFTQYGPDTLLRVLMFWAVLLPLGAKWSLDSRAGRVPAQLSNRFMSAASIGLFFQVACMYWFTILLKSGAEWRTDFTALWYALGARQASNPLGQWLFQYEDALKVFTFFTVVGEILTPILLLFPFRNSRYRMAGIAGLWALHFGIWLTLDVGLFPYYSSMSLVCFLPSRFWEVYLPFALTQVRDLRARLSERLVLLPRGLGGALESPSFAYSQGAGEGHVSRMTTAPRAHAVRTGGSRMTEPAAGPQGTGERLRTPLWLNLIAVFSIAAMLSFNVQSVSSHTTPRQVLQFGQATGLYQAWYMFAPRPPAESRWFVIAGTQADGNHISLLQPLVQDDFSAAPPLDLNIPVDMTPDYYGDIRWRYFLQGATKTGKEQARNNVAGYICRNWNAQHSGGSTLQSLTIASFAMTTVPAGDPQPETRKRIEGSYSCQVPG
jgi:hypothetical protein